MASFCSENGLQAILQKYNPTIDAGLVNVLSAIAEASAVISKHLREAGAGQVEQVGTSNEFGDDQLHIDVMADEELYGSLRRCGAVAIAASEEKPQEQDLGGEGYSVGFDPLDGSSVIGANFAVGTIVGIWPGRGLLNRTGREQAASCMTVYGPRTTMVVALSEGSAGGPAVCFEVTHHPGKNQWVVSRERFSIAPAGKVFAPGNLRATSDSPKYKALFDFWVQQRYTLRYTGGMVPDVYHIFVKGKGVFSNVSSPSAKAKLRLLYEVAPIALMVEAAGGASVVAPDPTFDAPSPLSVLDVTIDNLDKRLGVCYGGIEEVGHFNKFMF